MVRFTSKIFSEIRENSRALQLYDFFGKFSVKMVPPVPRHRVWTRRDAVHMIAEAYSLFTALLSILIYIFSYLEKI